MAVFLAALGFWALWASIAWLRAARAPTLSRGAQVQSTIEVLEELSAVDSPPVERSAAGNSSIEVSLIAEGVVADVVYQTPRVRITSGSKEISVLYLDAIVTSVQLMPGDYEFEWGDDAWMSGKLKLSIQIDESKRSVSLALRSRYALVGITVEKGSDQAVGGLSVGAGLERMDSSGASYVFEKEPLSLGASFKIVGIPTTTGRINLHIKAPGFLAFESGWIELGFGATDGQRVFELVRLENATSMLQGIVVEEASGAPIPFAEVSVIDSRIRPDALIRIGNTFDCMQHADRARIETVVLAQGLSDGQGRFQIPLIGKQSFRFASQADGFATMIGKPVYSQSDELINEVRLSMAQEARLSFKVMQSVDAQSAGGILKGAWLVCNAFQTWIGFDAQGEVSVSGMPEGLYELKIQGTLSKGDLGGMLTTKSFYADQGAGFHEFVLGEQGTFAVGGQVLLPSCIDPKVCEVSLYSLEEKPRLVAAIALDEEAYFDFKGLSPGGYVAVAMGRPQLRQCSFAMGYVIVKVLDEDVTHVNLDFLGRVANVPLDRPRPFDDLELMLLRPQGVQPAFDQSASSYAFFQPFNSTSIQFYGLPDGIYRLESPSLIREFAIVEGLVARVENLNLPEASD